MSTDIPVEKTSITFEKIDEAIEKAMSFQSMTTI
jgi:hypothetical protein